MAKCMECKKECKGVLLTYDKEHMYIPELCESCLLKITDEQYDPAEEQGLVCPKCKQEVPILRDKECVDCYLTRCDNVIMLPSEIEEKEPPLGWLYTAQKLIVELEYEQMRARNHSKKEC